MVRHLWAKNLKTRNTECAKCGVRPSWDGANLSCSGFMPGLREALESYGEPIAKLVRRPGTRWKGTE